MVLRSALLACLALLVSCSEPPPVSAKIRPEAAGAVRAYVDRNFGQPGTTASWHSSVHDYQVVGSELSVTVTLNRSDERIAAICNAIGEYAFQVGASWGIAHLALVEPTGSPMAVRGSSDRVCRVLD